MSNDLLIGLCFGLAFGVVLGMALTQYAYETRILNRRLKEYDKSRADLHELYESAKKKMSA